MAWLDGRDRLQERMLWGILLAAAIVGAVAHLLSPDKWPDEDWVILWPVFAQYVLCVWIAIQAPRRLADDKESGALELLLCTPVKPAESVRGCMMMLRRRFGRAFLVLLALDLLLAYVYFSQHGGWERFQSSKVLELFLCGLAAFPVQAYSLARIGLYQGLVGATSLRATFMVIWKAGLLPWLSWIAFMLSMELSQRYLQTPTRVTDQIATNAWGCAHLLLCALFLAHASSRLQWNFRSLAAQPAGIPWWKRWLPLHR